MAHTGNNLSRREMIKLAGMGLVGAALASCGAAPTATPEPTATTAPKPTPTTAPAAPAPAAATAVPPPPPTATAVPPTATAAPTKIPATPTAAKPVHIKFWNWLDNPSRPEFPTLLKRFEDAHPMIRIDWELGDYASMHTKVITAMAAATAPDAFQSDAGWIGELNGMKSIQPLDDWVKDWTGRYDIFPTVLQQFQYLKGMPGNAGPLYGLPFLLVAHYMYYRKDWAQQVGFKGSHPSGGPGTMDEFVQLGKMVTDPKIPRYGFAMRGGAGADGMWFEVAGTMGLRMWDWIKQGETWKWTLDTDKAIKANTWYTELFTKQKICPPSAPTDSFAEIVGNMKSGLTCMTFHHMQTMHVIGDVIGIDNLGVVPVPKGADPKDWLTYGGAGCNAINTATQYKDQAFAWISFIASADFQDYWCKNYGGMPFNPSIVNDPFYQNDRFVKATLEGAPSWGVFPVTASYSDFSATQLPTNMQQCLAGKIGPDVMMKNLQAYFNAHPG